MKILNLYAGIGGNRKLWDNEHDITAVESEQYIADVYKQLYPNDTVIVGDAHQYLLDHFKEFDFIWSSPPCPTHSRLVTAKQGWGIYEYPDMTLYQEIIYLKHFFKGDWAVENVISYYNPLISPVATIDRHYIWSNKPITPMEMKRSFSVSDVKKEVLSEYHDIKLPEGTKNQRKLLRNAVYPLAGKYIFEQITKGGI